MKKFTVVFLILCSVFVTGCDSTAETSNQLSSDNNQNTVEKKIYGINEDVYVKNDSGEYRLKITGVSETDYRNEFSDKVADRVIIISYEYENVSVEDDLYISDYDFNAYDADNNKLETYPADIKYGGYVAMGRKASASMAFALNNSSNYIELEFYDSMWNSSSDCIFKLEW